MTKIKNNKAGFSLVELMVVVAIIGILASIAVPNFLKFQAKAKQSSAKTELSGLYGAQKTFFAEYNTFHSNLPYTGFVPDGIPLVAATNCPQLPATARWAPRLYSTGFTAAGAGALSGAVGTLPAPVCATAGATFYYGATDATGAAMNSTIVNPSAAATVAANSFVAESRGIVSSSATLIDIWTITQDKILLNVTSGI
jgi:type IV pilus assembly protein PilA